MKYGVALLLISVILLILSVILKNKMLRAIGLGSVIFFFIAHFIPRQIFGTWNSISGLNEKNITKIVLQPSEPNWDVNLVGSNFVIVNRKQIDTIMSMLQNVDVYFPTHPTRIWETKLIIVSAERDSLKIEINQTDNNATVIYFPTNDWRKDPLGAFLERITSYNKPVYSDTATTRN